MQMKMNARELIHLKQLNGIIMHDGFVLVATLMDVIGLWEENYSSKSGCLALKTKRPFTIIQ